MALVTGGSQGVGKGIVEGLSESGYTVYFTGRNSEKLTETENFANSLGGKSHSKRIDHTQDEQVESLFIEIASKHDLNLLVNNVWGGYEKMLENGRFTWMDPFWEQPLHRWDSMMNSGVRSAFVASQLFTKHLLKKNKPGLIINISFWSAQKHIGNVLYGIAKAATDKLTSDMANELSGKEIFVISLYPGLVRTEKVMEAADMLDLSNSESPRFIGRTIAALDGNHDMARQWNGKVCVAADIARNLGVMDIDGSSPKPLSLSDV